MTSARRAAAVTVALAAVPVAFLAAFFALPLGTLLRTGLSGAGTPVLEVLTDPSVRAVAWFTTWQASVSTLVTLAIGLPTAWVLARVDLPGRRLLQALLVVPFVLPTVVVGTAFLALLGPDGPVAAALDPFADGIDLRRTTVAIVAAHVFFNQAVIARTVAAAWSGIDPRLADAARSLGASRTQVLRHVTLPLLRPAIGGAAAIVFLFSFTSFGVVRILGGPRLATIEVEIHRLTTELLDLRTASVLAIVQLAAVVAALGLHQRLAGAGRATVQIRVQAARRPARGAIGAASAVVVAGTMVLAGAPIATLVWRSFDTGTGPSLASYRALGTLRAGQLSFVPPLEAVRNSLVLGAIAAVGALVLGGLTAVALHRLGPRSRAVADGTAMLPLGASAVTVGLGFLLALDEPPLDLRTSPALIPIAQALIALPFVVRTLLPALDALPPRLVEAAATLGASPARAWWSVVAPLLRRPTLVALGFAFAVSLGEFGATVFIARADLPTVPVAIFRALSQPGALSVGTASALSTILLVLTTATMLIVDRLGDGRVGRF